MNIKKKYLTLLLLMLSFVFVPKTSDAYAAGYSITDYSGEPYKTINNNEPSFTKKQKSNTKAFENYSNLDNLGRCKVAYANICKEIMPTEKRKSISSVKPSGWKKNMGWERCHLIGFQLAGENANEKNLITGTHYFNVTGMLPFENMVDDYIDETENHVLYRVTPKYKGNELIARGVQIEAWSVEDEGDGIAFNVFVYNVRPGYSINYSTGKVTNNNVKSEQKITGGTYKKTYKAETLSKSKKSFSIGAKSKTSITYKKMSGSSRITVDSKGKVTVKKGTKAGNYSIKVKLTAKESTKYKKKSVTKTVKVTVSKTSENIDNSYEPVMNPMVSEIYVYITDTGSKYHSSGCRYLKYSSYRISLTDAVNSGYTACSVCR